MRVDVRAGVQEDVKAGIGMLDIEMPGIEMLGIEMADIEMADAVKADIETTDIKKTDIETAGIEKAGETHISGGDGETGMGMTGTPATGTRIGASKGLGMSEMTGATFDSTGGSLSSGHGDGRTPPYRNFQTKPEETWNFSWETRVGVRGGR